jgi:hypothetical protein
MGKKAKHGGVRREGGRRGAGKRKHGLSRWATIWMDENFDYWEDRLTIQNTNDVSEEALDEMEELADKWEDIGSMMGGTVFLDYCMDLAYKLSSEAHSKAARIEAQLELQAAARGGFR